MIKWSEENDSEVNHNIALLTGEEVSLRRYEGQRLLQQPLRRVADYLRQQNQHQF